MTRPRILMVLPQMPQDPASGAARTAKTALEMAADGGFEVRALATTASERSGFANSLEYLQRSGLAVQESLQPSRHRTLHFEDGGIPYTLLDTGRFDLISWEATHGRQFDALFDAELKTFQPDILFTYGGLASDRRRHLRAKQMGSRIAFCVFNMAYLSAPFFTHIDAVTTPSEFMAKRYREAIGLASVVLPTPLDLNEVVASGRDPIFVTMINPSLEKGLFFMARLAEELGTRLPHIALLVIESRGTAGMLVEAGTTSGFDLRRHESIMIAGSVPQPRDIYANTRILLVPSAWEEPSGRVVAEALVNGVPPLVSDRGGLSESCNGAGLTLPLPANYSTATREAVAAADVEAWLAAIERFAGDEAYYQAESAKALKAGEIYAPANLRPKYLDFFEGVLRA